MDVTKADFDGINWQDVIGGCPRKDCTEYCVAFAEKAKQAQGAGEERRRAAFLLLTVVTAQHLRSDDSKEPFWPFGSISGFALPPLDALTNDQLSVLAELAQEATDPEAQARFADVVWTYKKDFIAGKLAVEAYLRAGDAMVASGEDGEATVRFGRSVDLAATVGRKAGLHDSVIDRIDAIISRDPSRLLLAYLLEVVRHHRPLDPKGYADLSRAAAEAATKDKAWDMARRFSEIEASYRFAVTDDAGARAARVRAAASYVLQADDSLTQPTPPSYLNVARLLSHALEGMKRNGAARERQDEVHARLLEAQEQSTHEMREVSHSFDATEAVLKARERVAEKPLPDALVTMASTLEPASAKSLRALARRIIKGSITHLIAHKLVVNERGRVVAPPVKSTAERPEDCDEVVRAEMLNHAVMMRHIAAVSTIEPMRTQINEEHPVRLADFMPFVTNNPFVPIGRELIFAQGLLAGQRGDFLLAGHFLIPQLENSIRVTLNLNGIVTTKMDNFGVQNEMDLNAVLYKPEIADIFGEDTAFDLQGLLVEHGGSNLRNLMAHGLMDLGDFHTPQIRYLWWLTFRICCIPIRKRRAAAKARKSEGLDDVSSKPPDRGEPVGGTPSDPS